LPKHFQEKISNLKTNRWIKKINSFIQKLALYEIFVNFFHFVFPLTSVSFIFNCPSAALSSIAALQNSITILHLAQSFNLL
jgi:hypothetical protein